MATGASLFPAILMGIFSTRINKAGAIAGMLTGLFFTFGYIVVYKGVFFAPLRENIPANWLFGISPEGIGVIGMLLNFAVATTIGLLGEKPPESVRKMVESIRVPRADMTV